jgi:diguanylate cyclase (GGDEF)-like protein
MTDSDLDLRHRLAVTYSVAICILLAMGLILRIFVASQYPVVVIFAVINLVLALLLCRLVLSARHQPLEGLLLLALSIFALVPLLLVTGGVNSQLTSVLVCFPFIAALLGNRKLPFITLAVIVILILGMLALNDVVVDISGDAISGWKVVTRAAWLITSVLIATAVGSYFQRAYIALTHMLETQASVDHLTGLLNRRGLEDRLDRELKRQKRTGTSMALMMLDVDNFKQFNDKYGHEAGDQCLVAVARCLDGNTRAEDLVARFGGEEFVVVLTNVMHEQALVAAEKLRLAVAAIKLADIAEPVNVTIGLVFIGVSEPAAREDLMRYADEALYRGKLNGRNQVVPAELPAA